MKKNEKMNYAHFFQIFLVAIKINFQNFIKDKVKGKRETEREKKGITEKSRGYTKRKWKGDRRIDKEGEKKNTSGREKETVREGRR